MILAMILAHLLGDYVFQTDRIARWKGQSLSGVLVHGLIVTGITLGLGALYDPAFIGWALLIGVAHTAFDALQLPLNKSVRGEGTWALSRLILDQIVHFGIIFYALYAGGMLDWSQPWLQLAAETQQYPWLAFVTGYVVLTMPTWVLIEFASYGLIQNSPPDFGRATNKYVSSLERWLITTCVITGQYLLVPVVAAPRLFIEREDLVQRPDAHLYLAKLLASIGLSIAIGWLLSGIHF